MRLRFNLIALLALAACSTSTQQGLVEAQRAFAAHDYLAARKLLASALASHPNDKALLLLQAKTLIAVGDGDEAKLSLDKLTAGVRPVGEVAELSAEASLLSHAPDAVPTLLGTTSSAEAERLRALASVIMRDNLTAAKHFKQGVALGGNARLFADYSRFFLHSGDLADAQAMADRAAKADPKNLDTLLIGGELATLRGDLSGSLSNFSKAAELYPASLAALTRKAAVLGDLGRLDEMQQILDRLAAFAQGDRTILALRAKAAATRKDWAGVKTIVQGVETNLQANDPLRRLYGEAFLRLGQPELAIAQFTPIVRGQPGNREARRLLGEGLLAAGDAKGAMAALRPLAQGPARSADFAILAKTAQTLGDPAAKQYQARAVRLAAEALGNDLGRGSAAMAASNWAVAAHAYGRILAVTDGHNVMVLNNMAYAQLMMGNVDLALDFASRAVKLAPNNASVLDTAGWAQFKSGKDLAAAKGLLSKATRLAPANATITAHFAEAARANN